MQKFYEKTTSRPKLVVSIFLILFILCFVMKQTVSVNYDMSDYLPEDSASTVALDVMDSEFDGGIPNARIMVKNFSLAQQIRSTANEYYPDKYYLAGEGISTYDLKTTVTNDMVKVNLIAIGAVFIVLLLTMKSVSLPVILVLGIETAIWINLSIPYFAGNTIFYIAYLIISSIQLGATVDYAILLTDRYKEFRRTMPKKQAVTATISSVTVSILTSASVLTVVGFLLGFISTHGLLSQLGMFLGKGTLCSLAIVLFVLPGLLYICTDL